MADMTQKRHGTRGVLAGRLALPLLLMLVGVVALRAQELPTAPGAPVAVVPAASQNESEAETIARCLRDLRSSDVEARRRAAMIIGKYRVPAAQEAVLACLRDPDAVVRRSALVSLTEEDRMISPAARQEVFRLLSDPDVHIRRIASSMLGEISVGLGRVVVIPGRPGPLRPGVPAPPAMAADAENREALLAARALNEALGDDDASVRRNVLSAARFYPGVLDRARLERFFSDPSVEIRVLALQAYASLAGPEDERVDALLPLLEDADPRVREELARTAARLGAAGTAILKTLSRDGVLGVRIEAVRLYAAQQDPAALPLLIALIRDEAVPVDERAQLLRVLNVYPAAAGPVYDELADNGPAALRATAIRMLGTGRITGTKERSLAFFIDCLDDDSDAVVQAAGAVLQQRQDELSAAALRQLLLKRNPEARKLALRCTARLTPEEAGELLLDACLDDSVPVRQQALQLLVARQIPDWRDILMVSLEDSNAAIQQTAAEGLMRAVREPAVRTALTSYLERCTEPYLKQRLEQLLAARLPPVPGAIGGERVQPPVRIQPLPARPPVRRRVVPRR
ncbi:MAG: HEAT repeat domain-containing protein [Lentisphaeria bacterium]|nr:HEAT repeat domain-containing protein [Lentisphaeria bacterium]